jgi:hypothetical protein
MNPLHTSRRTFLRSTGAGFGWIALQALHAQWARAAGGNPLAPRPPHHAPRAKRVIFMFMQGGPSHLDTFDWKPELAKAGADSRLLAPVFKFQPHGRSGTMISEVFPHLAQHADHLCILNGMKTRNPGHQQATVALHTGHEMFVRPSMGAWIVYGLGSESEALPGFVTIDPIQDLGGAMNYGSAFLPATYQGTRFGSGGSGVPNLDPALGSAAQRRQLDFLQAANRRVLAQQPGHAEIEGIIQSYELACRMQTSVPASLDLGTEPDSVRALYGLDRAETARFGTQCLMARRLAEKGVRFIQLTQAGWDHHSGLREGLTRQCTAIDQPIAGLIADLRQRGMLGETLLVWGGEFGRGPHGDNDRTNGRGHNASGFTMWMAGGGVKGGHVHGATDPLGKTAERGVIDTHDLHATILHLLGLDHERLTFRYAGRDFRLTDVAGEVAEAIIA